MKIKKKNWGVGVGGLGQGGGGVGLGGSGWMGTEK